MMDLLRELTQVKRKIEENVETGRVNPSYLSGFESAGRIVLKYHRMTQESKGERT